MTPEAQRIEIAKACGWKQDRDGLWCYLNTIENQCLFETPDYLNSLDAMHEAEKVLSEIEYADFIDELEIITRDKERIAYNWREKYRTVHSNASQRAEAFLKTIGKWQSEDSTDVPSPNSSSSTPTERKD